MRTVHSYFVVFILGIPGICNNISLAEDGKARLYTTREEKREAGIKHEIFPGFVASGLAENEWQWEQLHLDNSDNNDTINDVAANIQGNFFITPLEWLKSEIITEFDSQTGEFIVDEAEIAFEYGSWELAFGRLYQPFGVYFSHFSNGPILEIGETRGTTVALAYNYVELLDINLTAYRSKARKTGSSSKLDWSLGIEAWPTDDLSVGISFISDLADSDERLLADSGNRYRNKVPALSAYALWVAENYEISFEILGALESFDELDSDRNQPLAANLEYTWFFTDDFDLSFRVEGSREIEDAPGIRFGLAFNYKVSENMFITLEGLHGIYKSSLATDDNDNDYNSVTTLGALLSVGF